MRKKLAEAKDGMRDPATLKKIRAIKNGEASYVVYILSATY
jgi:hypothetical protein